MRVAGEIAPTLIRKIVEGLEKNGQIKSYKPVDVSFGSSCLSAFKDRPDG